MYEKISKKRCEAVEINHLTRKEQWNKLLINLDFEEVHQMIENQKEKRECR
jgi:hypothetical protein